MSGAILTTMDYQAIVTNALANPVFFEFLVGEADKGTSSLDLKDILATEDWQISITPGTAKTVLEALQTELDLAKDMAGMSANRNFLKQIRWRG